MASQNSSMALQPRKDSFITVFAKHQLWPNSKPKFHNLDLANQTAVMIGGNSGIGLECSRIMLSRQLSRLILGVRSLEKGNQAAASLRKQYPKAEIEVWHVDMSSYQTMQAFAEKCAELPQLNIAIVSAGIMNVSYKTCPDTGHEEQFQINYLSTAYLSMLLLPVLKAKNNPGTPGRLTLVASGAALVAEFCEKDATALIPAFDKKDGWDSSTAKKRYDDTKGMTLMLTYRLSQLVDPSEVIVNVVDPTFTPGTSFFRELPWGMKLVLWPLTTLLGTSVNNAAWRYMDGAVARGKESHGSFISDWRINPFHQFMYTKEGERFMDRLWDETLQELDFPEVQDAMKALKTKSDV